MQKMVLPSIPLSEKFIQPLLHDFLNSFSLPTSFMSHLETELKGDSLQTVVLMSEHHPRRHWLVCIEDGRVFADGWPGFCLHHDLKVGEFLVFTYHSHFLFHVSVFDPVSACQRISSSPHSVKPIPKTIALKRARVELSSPCKTKPEENEDDEIAAMPSKPGNSSCVIRLTSYCIRNSIVHLPIGFARENGLQRRRCEMTIIDAKRRVWPVALNYKKCDNQVYINRGLKAFLAANRIKRRTLLSVQLLKGGACPTLKFCRLKRTGVKSNSDFKTTPKEARAKVVAASPSELDPKRYLKILSCHVCLSSSMVERSIIYLPAHFVNEGGLKDRHCEVKIIDEEHREWKAGLSKRKDRRSYIYRGWKRILTANCYMIGDVISFQLIEAGERPTLRCYRSCKTKLMRVYK